MNAGVLVKSFFSLVLCSGWLTAFHFVGNLGLVQAVAMAPVSSPSTVNYVALLARQVKKCKSVQEVMDILSNETWDTDGGNEQVFAQALAVCGKHKDVEATLSILKRVPNSELCRARAISICGNSGDVSRALTLIAERPLLTSGPYNSAIASCGHEKKWREALSVIDNMPKHLVTSITVNAALTTLNKGRRGTEALDLLNRAESTWNIKPDRISYHNTLSALLSSNQLEEGCRLVQNMSKSGNSETMPNNETFTRIAAAVSGKEKERATVVALLGEHIIDTQAQPGQFSGFQRWNIPKVGRGKAAYWTIGHIIVNGEKDPLIVGLQPNRNPAVNGMKLCFYRKAEPRSQKLGYLLMINSVNDGKPTSQFLGQFVDEQERGRGWAKLWLAAWLQLCLQANIQPCTGKMHKPLLCLVLQDSFGMLPKEGGIQAELSPGNEAGQVILYSSSRALEGAFSPLDQRKQNIKLRSQPMNPRGRPIVVGTSFEWPGHQILLDKVTSVLDAKWEMIEGVSEQTLQNMLLGK